MPAKKTSLFHKLTERSDIALALLLVTIIFMMILPMPTLIVDTLIALNMSLAIVLLMLAVYLPSPLSFSSFPSVLLLSTLFRLALSISTTRLILTEADAGKIIETFGEFVVAGNMVVGLVIFLIITIVQFIVITKGSERIAEVGARFSLDAMPGKQMSIDSDLRAGVISMQDARTRRLKLEKESQLYGSMDGAMKFVKGDAIAGLVIIIVNILGGITIGTVQNDMEIGSAMELYSVLTIGDGLVSQIPALFVSITAGIIVSRVTVDEDSNLGADISRQLLAQPNAILIAAGIVTSMGLIPGFPTVVFFILGITLGITGFLLRRMNTRQEFADADVTTVIGVNDENAKLTAGAGGGATPMLSNMQGADELKPLDPVLVELPESLRETVSLQALNQAFAKVRREFYTDLGVPLAGIGLRLSSQLPDNGYRLHLHGIPVNEGQINTQTLDDSLLELGTERNSVLELTESEKTLRILSEHLRLTLHRNASEFVGVQEVHSLLSKLEEGGYATLVQETQRAIPNTKIVDVLRRLLDENISIRDLRQILESLVEFAETEKDIGMLTERVRIGLKRQIAYAFTQGSGQLPVYMIDPESERLLQGSIRQTQAGIFFALQQDMTNNLANSIQSLELNYRNTQGRQGVQPVVLTNNDLRRHLRQHLSAQFPDLPVLSLQELPATVSVQSVGEIRLQGNTPPLQGGHSQ